jgi:hypothetical protein
MTDDDYPFEVCPVCGVPVEDHGDDWCPGSGKAPRRVEP